MSWVIGGAILFLFLLLVAMPFVVGVPDASVVFGSDAIGYSLGAQHLLSEGLYSFDGVKPFMDREPGMSFFLVPVYALFGVENIFGLVFMQSALLFLAAWFFCKELAHSHGERTAGITFILLLTSGSIFHALFSAYREGLALILLLVFSGLMLSLLRRSAPWKGALIGLAFGALILTYYSFVFFPVALLVYWRIQKRSWKEILAFFVVCYGIVSLWALRNYSYDGGFRVVDSRRIAVMWHVRGEQSEQIGGLEPFGCLWAEYVSRDWTGRSSACSYNRLMHERWPDDAARAATDYEAVAREGQRKILMNPISYLWFSLVDTLELHIPYLGGGISYRFNLFAAVTALLLYSGFFLGLPGLLNRKNLLFTLFIGYNTLFFALTDATPRYLVPVLFSYAVIAAMGYDWALARARARKP